MLLTSGAVTDRPWGQTLGALGTKRLTGQVTVTSDGKIYAVAFQDGAIVAASSPLASDAAVRVALTNHMISKVAVTDITRRLAAAPDRDEVEVIIEATKLSPELIDRLRTKLVTQRAARTLALERGEFAIEDEISLPISQGVAVAVPAAVYLGARMNIPEQLLTDALRAYGDAFVLKPEGDAVIATCGFTEGDEQRIIDELRNGTSLPELEAAHRDIDPRTMRAVVYTLFACGACDVQAAPSIPRASTATVARTSSRDTPPTARTSSRETPFASRTVSTDAPVISRTSTSPAGLRAQTDDGSVTASAMAASRGQAAPSIPRTMTPVTLGTGSAPPPLGDPSRVPTRDVVGRVPTGNVAGRVPTRNPVRAPTSNPRAPTSNPIAARAATNNPIAARAATNNPIAARAPTGEPMVPRTLTARRTAALIQQRWALVETGADHFAVLGVPYDAPMDVIRTTYLDLTRQLHPDKLTQLGVDDPDGIAGKLFAQISLAFATLTDAGRRDDYMLNIARPDLAELALPRTKTSEDRAFEAAEAFEAFRRGEVALRRNDPAEACVELLKAVELSPFDVDYQAMLGWARFCAATDRVSAAPATRLALEKAIQKSAKPVNARFLLGRVERMLGRDREALHHFEQVLDLQGNHAEAQSEIRAIEIRAKSKR